MNKIKLDKINLRSFVMKTTENNKATIKGGDGNVIYTSELVTQMSHPIGIHPMSGVFGDPVVRTYQGLYTC